MPAMNLYSHPLHGALEGPVVIFGPALGATADMWTDVAALLASDHRTLRYENFGFADAPVFHSAFTIRDLADAVVRLMDDVGIESAHYAGDSISGAVALELGRRYPDRIASVTAVCSVARRADDSSFAPMINAVRDGGTESRATDIIDRWFAPGAVERHGEKIGELVTALSAADDHTYANYLSALEQHDIGDHLSEVAVPVLSIWSEFDTGDAEGKMRFIAEGVQRGTLVGILGAGHVPPIEKPQAVADALRTFVMSVR